MLTFPLPCISESCIEIKVKLNFYFHTSLWFLEKFYEGQPFEAPQRIAKFFFFFLIGIHPMQG